MRSPTEPADLAVTTCTGLTSEEAARRLAECGPNTLPSPKTPNVVRRAATHVREPLSVLLIGAAAVSGIVLEHGVEAGAILGIVLLNVAMATLQERRADAALAELATLSAPTARVRRDGETVVISAEAVVPGDVCEVFAGDRIPADLDVVEAASFAVDESILTGESLPVEKRPGGCDPGAPLAEQRGAAFAATMAVRGHAVGVVRATGSATAVGAIAAELDEPAQPPLVRELNAVARTMSVVAAGLGILIVPLFAWRGDGDEALATAVLAGVALAVAAVPEGLATVIVSALALGARTMAARGAIVRMLPAIETLGSTTVLCTDKTGTLTTGHLTVTSVIAAPGVEVSSLWRAALRASSPSDGAGDPVDVAIATAAASAGVRDGQLGERIAEAPFDATTKCAEAIHVIDGRAVLSTKGAPEVIAERCDAGAGLEVVQPELEALLGRGERALAVAERPSGELHDGPLTLLGVIGFSDPLRSTTHDTVAACHRAGIRLVMVTGDHASTARAIAAAAGLPTARIVTGDELASMSPPDRRSVLRDADVVARVEPSTKVDLVDAHRDAGEVVAMTGDGVNDAPALQRADIGIAIAGSAGTDVARAAAGLVVTNGDLGTIASAVAEGRRIYRNLTNVVSYLLAGNLSEVMVVIGSVVMLPTLAVPLLPVQLLWVNLVTDGLPALALGVDNAPSDPLGAPPRRASERMLSPDRLRMLLRRALTVACCVLASAGIGKALGWSDAQVRTQLLLSLLLSHLTLAYVTRASTRTFERGWSRNRNLAGAMFLSIALQVPVFGTSAGRDVFSLEPLPLAAAALAMGSALATVALEDAVGGWRRAHRSVPVL